MSGPFSLEDALRAARRLLVVSGAGVSAESGIPTYRGVAGLYNDDDGAQVMRDLSLGSYRRDPDRTYARVESMRRAIGPAEPNPAHRAIAACQSWCDPCLVVTQNIDGLHGAAGSEDVVELHGSVWRLACPSCGERWPTPPLEPPVPAPPCPACGADVGRHDVVLFGEQLPATAHVGLERAFTGDWDTCLVVGTTGMFGYVQQLVYQVRASGGQVIEVNPTRTELSPMAQHHVRQPAGEALAPLLAGGVDR